MKNKIIVSILLVSLLLVAAGCASNNASPENATDVFVTHYPITMPSTTEAPPATTEPAADDGTVRPLPLGFDINKPDNCSFRVCFGGSDVVVDENKNVTVTLEVYTHDTYNPDEIKALKAGDTVIIDGKVVKVENVRESAAGGIEINAKGDEEGIIFALEDDGTYYIDNFSAIRDYYKIGEVTLPVSKNFVYTNEEKFPGKETTATLQEILDGKAKFEYDFEAFNATVTVKNGEVVSLHKNYVP